MTTLVPAVLFVIAGAAARPPPPPLLDAFAPLTWATKVNELSAAFPGANVQVDHLDDPKRLMVRVSNASTGTLGDVSVVMEATRRGELYYITYGTRDRRPQCDLERGAAEKAPRREDCTWRGGPRAKAILAAWEKMIRKQLGPPSREPDDGSGNVFYKWQTPGYTVFVSLTQGDDGFWEVSLAASREEHMK